MRNKVKKTAGLIVSIVMLIVMFMLPAVVSPGILKAYAGESLDNCGPNLSVSIGGGTCTLTIGVIDKNKGSTYRYMYNYVKASDYSWHSRRADIEVISIEAGVYGISNYAFEDMINLETVYIPKSMKEIGIYAFSGCTDLTVYYSGTEEQWNDLIKKAGTGNDCLKTASVICGDAGTKTLDFRGPDGTRKAFESLYNFSIRNAFIILENNGLITWDKTYSISNKIDLDKDGNDDIVCNFYQDPSSTMINASTDTNFVGSTYTISLDEDTDITGLEDFYRFYSKITFIFPPEYNGDKGSFSLDLLKEQKLSIDEYYAFKIALHWADKPDASIKCNFAGPITEVDLDKDGTYDIILDSNGYPENIVIRKTDSCSIKTDTYTLKLKDTSKKILNENEQNYYGTIVFKLNEMPKTEDPPKETADPPKETGKTDNSETKKTAVPAKSAITPSNPSKLTAVAKKITAITNDKKDVAGSTFSLLQAKGTPVKKSNTQIKISWKKVKGAKKYVIYGNKCGKNNKYKKITTVTKLSYTQKKLKKGTYYKYIIVAVDKNGKAIATSKTVHVAANGGTGKKGNATSVTLSKTSLSLKAGKSKTLKATIKYGKLKGAEHRKIAWESSNIYVAKVKAGKITAVTKGTCYIYAYAQNGKMAKVKVTVK